MRKTLRLLGCGFVTGGGLRKVGFESGAREGWKRGKNGKKQAVSDGLGCSSVEEKG